MKRCILRYGVLDDLGREPVAAIGDRFHRRRLEYRHSRRKPINVTAPLEAMLWRDGLDAEEEDRQRQAAERLPGPPVLVAAERPGQPEDASGNSRYVR